MGEPNQIETAQSPPTRTPRELQILETICWAISPAVLLVGSTLVALVLGASWLRAALVFSTLATCAGSILLYRPQSWAPIGRLRSAALIYTGVAALPLLFLAMQGLTTTPQQQPTMSSLSSPGEMPAYIGTGDPTDTPDAPPPEHPASVDTVLPPAPAPAAPVATSSGMIMGAGRETWEQEGHLAAFDMLVGIEETGHAHGEMRDFHRANRENQSIVARLLMEQMIREGSVRANRTSQVELHQCMVDNDTSANRHSSVEDMAAWCANRLGWVNTSNGHL